MDYVVSFATNNEHHSNFFLADVGFCASARHCGLNRQSTSIIGRNDYRIITFASRLSASLSFYDLVKIVIFRSTQVLPSLWNGKTEVLLKWLSLENFGITSWLCVLSGDSILRYIIKLDKYTCSVVFFE